MKKTTKKPVKKTIVKKTKKVDPKLVIFPLVAIGVLIIGILGVKAIKRLTAKPTVDPKPIGKKRQITEPVNIIDVSERPYLSIIPTADGRNIILKANALKKPASEFDFEMMYQSGNQLQGITGSMKLASIPASDKFLLGSCSTGGKCTYHENVKGGTITTRFSGLADVYALKQDFKYIDNASRETDFSSKDMKFQISSQDLAKQRFLIIFNSPGYPEGLSGLVKSEPYALNSSGTLSGSAELTIKASSGENLKIAGWNGTQWQEFETTSAESNMVTATVDLVELYVVVGD